MILADKLYAYVWQGSDNNCNSYLLGGVLQNNRHLLIDPGHIITPFYRQPGLDRLTKEMEGDGVDAGAIGLIVLTHAHPDHCEAARVIRERSGALVALHEAEQKTYERLGGKLDMLLEEGELVLGKENPLKLNIFHSPGHSPGHITIYWPDRKVLFTGDVIFYRSTGRVDLPGGSVMALKQSIHRLSELDVEYLLCGHPYGHPGIIEGKQAVKQNFDLVKTSILL